MKQILTKVRKRIIAYCLTELFRAGFMRLSLSLLKAAHCFSRPPVKSQLLGLSSVVSAAERLNAQRQKIYPERTIRLAPLSCRGIGASADNMSQREHFLTLPPLEITTFRNITVIGGTEILCTDDQQILYDELALGDPDRYGCKNPDIIPAQARGLRLPACRDGHVLLSYVCPESKPVSRAIHLCKDHSSNYFHWLFECLPRLIITLQESAHADYPLLIDKGLPKQNIEALKKIGGEREIIFIGRGEMRPVEELVFPGVFSFTHDNYGKNPSAQDILVAPESVNLLRKAFLPATNKKSGKKRLYVTRDAARYRRLLNEKQIQARMLERGFEIIRPETLSFAEQLALFSEAEIIVGPTGAGMSNMLFAPPSSKIVVLAGATHNANYFIFGQVAQWLNQSLIYMTGKATNPKKIHSDYRIDMEQLDKLLDSF